MCSGEDTSCGATPQTLQSENFPHRLEGTGRGKEVSRASGTKELKCTEKRLIGVTFVWKEVNWVKGKKITLIMYRKNETALLMREKRVGRGELQPEKRLGIHLQHGKKSSLSPSRCFSLYLYSFGGFTKTKSLHTFLFFSFQIWSHVGELPLELAIVL
jgi:hypothetical protein